MEEKEGKLDTHREINIKLSDIDVNKKNMVFDTGPFISLVLNNLLWIIEPLKNRFDGEFLITKEVYKELVLRPFNSRNFKFEALQMLPLIDKKIIRIIDDEEIKIYAKKLDEEINQCFTSNGYPIQIIHMGELEVLSAAIKTNSKAVVIDERTTRMIIESPEKLHNYLEKKLHTKIDINNQKLDAIREKHGIAGLKVIRSFELASVAYSFGFLDKFTKINDIDIFNSKDIKEELLTGVLWSIKLKGCSVSENEINEIKNHMTRRRGLD